MFAAPKTPPTTFGARRRALAALLGAPAILAAGLPHARNYPANRYPFRASSHFLYFTGAAIPGAALLLARDEAVLFAEPPAPDDALWHGPSPSFDDLCASLGVDAVRPIADLPAAIEGLGPVATLPTQDAASLAWLTELLGRRPSLMAGSPDEALADAILSLRLRHDAAAIEQLRATAAASAEAHVAGMRATRGATNEREIAAAMLFELHRRGLGEAYGPIVTVRGEVLHMEAHDGAIAAGDLLLADVGGESPEGWAADITRVWPVSGTFSATQRAIYDVVLAAERAAIAKVQKGTRYREVHEVAKRTLVTGLKDLGIFRGDVDGLLERGAAAVFFPHGVGHLLGLDVHDMEDLGDRAGYAPGRTRSPRFGDKYLRLDRDLVPGMAVTIEPGFYQVPAILADSAVTGPLGADLRRDVLARFADVRGIRIEDDVVCTEGEPEVLTSGAPKDAAAIEALMAQ